MSEQSEKKDKPAQSTSSSSQTDGAKSTKVVGRDGGAEDSRPTNQARTPNPLGDETSGESTPSEQ
jgi:hypothetical protein